MIGLEYIRKLYNDTAESLAQKVGVTKGLISQWENQKRPIPEKRSEEISKLYDVPTEYLSKELTPLEELKVQKTKVSAELDASCGENEEPVEFDSNGNPTKFSTFTYCDTGLLEHLRDIEANIKIEKVIEEVRSIIGNSFTEVKEPFGYREYVDGKEQDANLIHMFVSLMKKNNSMFLARILRAIEKSDDEGENWGDNPFTDNDLVSSVSTTIRNWRQKEKKRREKEYEEYKELFGIEGTDDSEDK